MEGRDHYQSAEGIVTIKFPKEAKDEIIPIIQDYFLQERDETLGNLETEFLLDFFLEKIGPLIYNQALQDVKGYLHLRLVDIEDGLYELEKPMPRRN